MDYNAHLSRGKAKNKEGIHIYSRKFRKQMKKWDATPTLEHTKYPHIPSLMKGIERQHQQRDTVLRNPVQSPYNQPMSIQKTIGNSQPEATSEILRKKRSQFENHTSNQ